MLRIVSLSEWIAESGLFAESLSNYALAQSSGGDTTAAVQDLAEIMVKGMSYGTSGSGAAMPRLSKAALEQLRQMSGCRYLPLEEVHEDLKIWHLTLLTRPDRKKITLSYGKAVKREAGFDYDPEVLAQIARGDSEPEPIKRKVQTDSDEEYEASQAAKAAEAAAKAKKSTGGYDNYGSSGGGKYGKGDAAGSAEYGGGEPAGKAKGRFDDDEPDYGNYGLPPAVVVQKGPTAAEEAAAAAAAAAAAE